MGPAPVLQRGGQALARLPRGSPPAAAESAPNRCLGDSPPALSRRGPIDERLALVDSSDRGASAADSVLGSEAASSPEIGARKARKRLGAARIPNFYSVTWGGRGPLRQKITAASTVGEASEAGLRGWAGEREGERQASRRGFAEKGREGEREAQREGGQGRGREPKGQPSCESVCWRAAGSHAQPPPPGLAGPHLARDRT